MLQTLLSLMLAAVQVMAWNAAPVYLCLEADGSACVDRGPMFCDCCHSGAAAHGGRHCASDCADDACVDEGHHTAAGHAVSEGPCGCEHQQISDAQSAVKGRDRSGVERDNHSVALALIATVAEFSPNSEFDAVSLPEIGPSSALAARAGVVLRL